MRRNEQFGLRAAALAVCPHTHPARAPLHDEENFNVTIRQSCWQKCRESIARREGWETSLRPGRQGRQSHQPSSGDRHRSFRSAQAWRQGPQEKVVAGTRLDSAQKGVNPNQVFSLASSRKQTIAPLKGCQLFAMFRAHFYSTMLSSRIRRNSMKINDRGLGYPTINRGSFVRFSALDFRVSNFASFGCCAASHNVSGGTK